MNGPTTNALGLYSIGIRGIDVPTLLSLAAHEQVPFVHLRGGPRGHNLGACSQETLAAWASQSKETTPITVVTADLDLHDFSRHDREGRLHAMAELHRLADATVAIGAGSVRLVACHAPDVARWSDLCVPDLTASHGLATLIELHDPSWFTPTVLSRLLEHMNGAATLLLDTAQFQAGYLRHGDETALSGLRLARPCLRVVHLSDNGTGLTGAGHRIVAKDLSDAANRKHKVEVAFEWTGSDRSATTCLGRYRRAVEWWHGTTVGERS